MKYTTLVTLIALTSTGVYAEEKPFYLKASLGHTEFDSESSYALRENLSSTGYAFIFGYRVNRYIAVEGGMTDLGSIRRDYESNVHGLEWYIDDDDFIVENYDYKSKQEAEYNSYSVGLALTAPIQQNLNAGIRLGVHQWCENNSGQSETSGTLNWYNGDRELLEVEPYYRSYSWDNEKDSGSNPYYGVEVNWTTGDWSISLEHTVYEIQDDKANFSAVGITYSF
ncbi:outer membrane beta-barrel protein [Microbulbifer sp. MLAF003]|uniref:outer membrane beta-barrel protein n=1 Tax=Microbulbifer sp. MLAF003 TaxID=3032582 RepID=UPI0024ACFE2A|nr:outer membrane beta-barrel protein [Microbulbifer sp. MLAF003]WHI52323.1 outer membrane beta-barrel protein [Microbulbifer sp. MLAF003]